MKTRYWILLLCWSLPFLYSYGQSAAEVPYFDLFYVVNSTAGGGGLSQDQIEGLSDHIADAKSERAKARLLVYVSDGPEPWLMNETAGHRSVINRLYISSTQFPLSKRQELLQILDAIASEPPFEAARKLRLHFYVPDSFIDDVNREYSVMLDFIELLGLAAGQEQIEVNFYNEMLSKSDWKQTKISEKLTYDQQGLVKCNFEKS